MGLCLTCLAQMFLTDNGIGTYKQSISTICFNSKN